MARRPGPGHGITVARSGSASPAAGGRRRAGLALAVAQGPTGRPWARPTAAPDHRPAGIPGPLARLPPNLKSICQGRQRLGWPTRASASVSPARNRDRRLYNGLSTTEVALSDSRAAAGGSVRCNSSGDRVPLASKAKDSEFSFDLLTEVDSED